MPAEKIVILKETSEFEVFLETDKYDEAWKKFRSENYNYDFRLSDGLFNRWGKTTETADDPEMSPFGPEILDLEITDICNGVDGKLCPYCYKNNTPHGKNMPFEAFKAIIEKINYNSQLTQVAFGLGSTASENSALWAMCDYLRNNHIIPNGTVAQLDECHAQMIAKKFGGCAVSYHGSFNILADTVQKLTNWKNKSSGKLAQVNIHFMIAEETYDEALKLFELVKSDVRFKNLHTIVFLGLKKCGRAKNGFTKLSDTKFEKLIKIAFAENIGLGFDSCQANKFAHVISKIANEGIINLKHLNALQQMIEPCEGSCFSAYSNVDGVYFHCSFMEQTGKMSGFDLLSGNFKDYWDGKIGNVNQWRQLLKESNRNCPEYNV